MMSSHTFRRVAVVTAGAASVALVLGVGVGAQPAQAAVALDVSGVELSFVNAADVLVGAAAGASVDYANVATIDGIQVDATLTVLESFNLMADDLKIFVSQNTIALINPLKTTEEPLVKTGCYDDVLVNGEPFGGPLTTTVPSQYRVGSETFSSSSFDPGSDFLTGSRLDVADEADATNPADDRKINTHIESCGGVDFTTTPFTFHKFPGFVRYRIDFTTGDAKTPVFLKNVTMSAFDIDGGQYLRIFSPLPDSYRVFDTSLLDVCGPAALTSDGACTGEGLYAGSSAFLNDTAANTLEFYGDDSSDAGEVYEWAAEATYTQPVSSLSYQFGVRSGSSGSSLAVGFGSIDWSPDGAGAPTLADTGSSPAAPVLVGAGLLALLLGGLLLHRRAPRTARY